MAPESTPQLLTAQEVADRLGTSVATVKLACKNRELRASKIGRAWAVTPEHADAWWQNRTASVGRPSVSIPKFNLITERWLPVSMPNGTTTRIAPWEMAADPNPKGLVLPRPDFDVSILEFLIGLIQTVCPPKSPSGWQAWRETPPEPATLLAAMEPFLPYFNLLGERPLFMQDLTLSSEEENVLGIASLLIDSPGENALKKDTDFFVKRGRVETLCPACAAMALYTMQTFAPAGGPGHRTSLRGGGPLSTLVLGKTLWETVWSNVLIAEADTQCMPPIHDVGRVFPWTVPTRISDGKGTEYLPEHGHPLHTYWGMPRRYRLHAQQGSPEECDICGDRTATTVRSVGTRPYGNNYTGWRHPLTPYYEYGKSKDLVPCKGTWSKTNFTVWGDYVFGTENEKGLRTYPALCVAQFAGLGIAPAHIQAAGYDMSLNAADAWCEVHMPLYPLPTDANTALRDESVLWISVAKFLNANLLKGLKKALFADGGRKSSNENTVLANASRSFYSRVETVFARLVSEFAQQHRAELESEEDVQKIRRKVWASAILAAADDIFNEQAGTSHFDARTAPRVYGALNEMRRFNRSLCNKELGLKD